MDTDTWTLDLEFYEDYEDCELVSVLLVVVVVVVVVVVSFSGVISFFCGVEKCKGLFHDGRVWIARFAGLFLEIVNTKESGVCFEDSVVCDFVWLVSNGQPFWRTQFCRFGACRFTTDLPVADHDVATLKPFDHSSCTWRSCRK